MSGTGDEGTPPPEVPEEFAAVYRAAYERALAEQSATSGGGGHRSEEPEHRASDRVAERLRTWRTRRWFVPLLLACAAALLVLAAYGVGRVFAGAVNEAAGPDSGASASVPTGRGAGTAAAWQGPVVPVKPARATTGCTAPASVNAAGHRVRYSVSNVLDHKHRTAWRCNGHAIGVRIVLHLDHPVPVGEVGLIPGYAKTDRKSHVDRYAQNNRITKVRWQVGDVRVTQTMSGNPKDRSLRTIRVPRTRTDTITMEIRAVRPGPRNTTCISAIRVGAAR